MDIKHFFIEKGEGEPLILLHGNADDSSYFKNQIDEFSKFYHVYAIDTRGHGKTPIGNMPFTIHQFADDLLGFMDEQKIEKAHLLGFSDGGNIAMIFVLKYPNRVNKLILNGANLYPAGVKRTIQVPVEIRYNIAKILSFKNESMKFKAKMLGLMVNEPNVSPNELSKIQADTLVIAGTKDLIKEEHTKLIASNIPNSKIQFVKGNHFIAKNNPKDFNRAILEFLNH